MARRCHAPFGSWPTSLLLATSWKIFESCGIFDIEGVLYGSYYLIVVLREVAINIAGLFQNSNALTSACAVHVVG